MANTYPYGQSVTAVGSFMDSDSELADPEVVVTEIRSPDGAVTVITRNADSSMTTDGDLEVNVTRVSLGTYEAVFNAEQGGRWLWRMIGTTDDRSAVVDGYFDVTPQF